MKKFVLSLVLLIVTPTVNAVGELDSVFGIEFGRGYSGEELLAMADGDSKNCDVLLQPYCHLTPPRPYSALDRYTVEFWQDRDVPFTSRLESEKRIHAIWASSSKSLSKAQCFKEQEKVVKAIKENRGIDLFLAGGRFSWYKFQGKTDHFWVHEYLWEIGERDKVSYRHILLECVTSDLILAEDGTHTVQSQARYMLRLRYSNYRNYLYSDTSGL